MSLAEARAESVWARCRRRQVGCVLVTPLGTFSGHNRAAPGAPDCLDGGCPRGLRGYDEIPAFTQYDVGAARCVAIHAEVMALEYAAAAGVDIRNATAYITCVPCRDCAIALAEAGITEIITPDGRKVGALAFELNRLADKVHQNSFDHGFWPVGGEAQEERNFGEIIALIHSEASEALEAHRSRGLVASYSVKMPTQAPYVTAVVAEVLRRYAPGSDDLSDNDLAILARAGIAKPEGVASELVDVLIRTLDALRGLYPDLDIDDKVEEKMAYNATRPAKHGKAY